MALCNKRLTKESWQEEESKELKCNCFVPALSWWSQEIYPCKQIQENMDVSYTEPLCWSPSCKHMNLYFWRPGVVFVAENLRFGQIIFGKARQPKLNAFLWLLLFSRGFWACHLLLPLAHCSYTKMLHVWWKHLMLDTVHTQKISSLRQRSDNLRWQMTYERQQSKMQQWCKTSFCIVVFDISKRLLHLDLTSSPSPE